MINAFKQIRLTNADLVFSGNFLRASGKTLAYNSDVVQLTGSQSIAGNKTFTNDVTVSGGNVVIAPGNNLNVNAIYNANQAGNQSSIDLSTNGIWDASGVKAISWANSRRELTGAWHVGNILLANKVNLSGGQFFGNHPTNVSIDFLSRYLADSSNTMSVQWNNRLLTNSSAATVLDWENGIFYNDASEEVIDFQNKRLREDSSTSLDWGNRILSGTWNAQNLTIGGAAIVLASTTGASLLGTFPTHTQTGQWLVGKDQTGASLLGTFATNANTGAWLVGKNQTGASLLGTFPTHTQTGTWLVGKDQTGNFIITGDTRAFSFNGALTFNGNLSVPSASVTFGAGVTISGNSVVTQNMTGIYGQTFVATSTTGASLIGTFPTHTQTGQWLVGKDQTGASLVGTFPTHTQTGSFLVGKNQTGNFVGKHETGNFITTQSTGSYMSADKWNIFTTGITTGSDLYWITFPTVFGSVPKIAVTLEVAGDYMYNTTIRNRTVSGYYLMFSDVVAETGVVAHTFASIV